jgi:glyoxylase-like metal-dependent hydrolase (beta-lactamase superfamily II)
MDYRPSRTPFPITLNKFLKPREKMIEPDHISDKVIANPQEDPYKVTSELVDDAGTKLTSFFFNRGANFYVFSYPHKGSRRHTLIDTGDPMYRDRIESVLADQGINSEDIERIIITHRHHDHCGLADLLAQKSGAKILVHANFRQFIEGPLTEMDRMWLRGFEPARLRRCRVEYLSPREGNPAAIIDGLAFPFLSKSIPVGGTGRLEILACPESDTMHSPDQIIVHYGPHSLHDRHEKQPAGDRPANHILFSGDLWLMHGPLFSKSFRALSLKMRMASRQLRGIISGQKRIRRDPRIQDTEAKEALKHGFSLIRVMPGHGDGFLGTRLIPLGFLCDRDLLVELGYSMNEKKSILKSDSLSHQIKAIREKAYTDFIKELMMWKASGYNPKEISDFLVRLFREQHGGGPLVNEDRKERRQRIRETLVRLSDEGDGEDGLKTLAESTLAEIKRIS